MLKTIPNKIADFVQKLEALPVTQLYKLDGILSDLDNHLYDIGEHVSEMPEKSKLPDPEQTLAELTARHKQLMSLYKLLIKMEYDSHYMDRTLHTLGYVTEDIKKMMDELKE